MLIHTATAKRWLMGITFWGSFVCLLAWIVQLDQRTFFSETEFLFLFGVGVIIPLAMNLAMQTPRNGYLARVFVLAIYFHPFVILTTACALWSESSILAAILASFWVIQGSLLGFYGLQRLLGRPYFAIEEICIDAGLVYIAISSIWFGAYCADFNLLTFSPALVLLTAVHFIFIPGGLVIGGFIGRAIFDTSAWKFYKIGASVLVVSPSVVAAGITVGQFSGNLWLELGSAVMLGSSIVFLTVLLLVTKMPYKPLPKILLVLSLAALLLTMTLAIAYPLGRLTNWWSLSLTSMVQWHGWFNAIGFVLCGLLGLLLETPPPQVSPAGIPFSKLSGRGPIGPNYFKRVQALDEDSPNLPLGIVDSLQDFQQANFNPEVVPPAIRAFYEQTARHDLLVYPEWQARFRFLARGYKRLSRWMGQMNFPLWAENSETHISSAIVPLNDALDGRQGVRGWIRTYTETAEAVYVAAYAIHRHQDSTYMNIAFPLPFGNLTSILNLKTLISATVGLELSSFSTRWGDQGVFFVNRLLTLRLPINETITVFAGEAAYKGLPADFPSGEIAAQHKIWVFGLHCLTLHYSISPREPDKS